MDSARVPRDLPENDEPVVVQPSLEDLLRPKTEEEDALSLADFDDEQQVSPSRIKQIGRPKGRPNSLTLLAVPFRGRSRGSSFRRVGNRMNTAKLRPLRKPIRLEIPEELGAVLRPEVVCVGGGFLHTVSVRVSSLFGH